MNARSALFDLYGDHLRARGGQAPVASLVRLMAPLGVTAPAVRTAVSRMTGQGWLAPVRLAEGAGYRLTEQAESRLAEAARRIYRQGPTGWDGRWHVLVLPPVTSRSGRDRVRGGLAYLGYAALRDSTWISPRASEEIDALLAAEGVEAKSFRARFDGDGAALAAGAWNLDDLGRSYARWTREARALIGDLALPLGDEQAFVVRSRLVHEWRKFLFRDPGLPRELLPKRWPGDETAAFFNAQAERLLPAAARFVDACLSLVAAGCDRPGAADAR